MAEGIEKVLFIERPSRGREKMKMAQYNLENQFYCRIISYSDNENSFLFYSPNVNNVSLRDN